MLLVVLCSFSVPFGKLFSKIFSSFLGLNASNIGSIGITAPTATLKFEGVAVGAAAVKEKSESSLFVKREIDDYRQDTYKFRIYARITRRAGNGEAWESLNNRASACCMSLSRALLALQILNLAEIT